jgi:hypothetical protein
MAKIEAVKVTHTYIIRREGEAMPKVPEPVVNIHPTQTGVIVEHEETTVTASPFDLAPALLTRFLRELGAHRG